MEITLQQGIPKGNQPWIFIGRTVAEAEAPILGHLMWRATQMKKTPDAGKDWRQKKKGVAEDEMVRKHHWLNGCKFEKTQRDNEGQGNLVCYSPCHKELDVT